MTTEKTRAKGFVDLTGKDLDEWAGKKIVSRGKSYQRQGCVSDLAVTKDGGLVAWVAGSKRYATRVVMDEGGLPDSICTCPYELDCKHGVAVVIEYLKRIENNQNVPKAKRNDERLELLEDEDWDDDAFDDENVVSEEAGEEINAFLKGKTKAQLIDLIRELAQQHREIAQDLLDRRHLTSGNTKALVTRLRREILDIGDEPGWQNYWKGEGYTPDYSGIRKKLEPLLEACRRGADPGTGAGDDRYAPGGGKPRRWRNRHGGCSMYAGDRQGIGPVVSCFSRQAELGSGCRVQR